MISTEGLSVEGRKCKISHIYCPKHLHIPKKSRTFALDFGIMCSIITEEEFYAKIDHSFQQEIEGKVYRSMPGESADAFLDRLIAMGDRN